MDIHCSKNRKKGEVMRGIRNSGSLLPPGEKVSARRISLPRARGGSFFQETFQMVASSLAPRTCLKLGRYMSGQQAQLYPLFMLIRPVGA